MNECAVLFSGGTDSLCAAALSCQRYNRVHLLTFFEQSTESSPVPSENVERLRQRFPETEIFHTIISTDSIVQELSYQEYLKNLFHFGFINLATPGLSSLSWHIATIKYCQSKNIKKVFDGMTRELLHLPGHMPRIRHLFAALYDRYEIDFSSPVIDWDVPQDQRFVDKLIIDKHGFGAAPQSQPRTTGQWLFDNNLLPHPNIKGSSFDRLMQHDCYPFIIYNMLVFWIFEPLFGFKAFEDKLEKFFIQKIQFAVALIEKS